MRSCWDRGCPIKTGIFIRKPCEDTKDIQGESHITTESEIRVVLLQTKGMPRIVDNHQSLGRDNEGFFSRVFMVPSVPWLSDFKPPELKENFCLFFVLSHSVCGNLLWRTQEMNTLWILPNNSEPTTITQPFHQRWRPAHQSPNPISKHIVITFGL